MTTNVAGFVSLWPQGDAGDAHDDREPPNRGAQPRADGAAGVRAAGEGGAGGQGARPPGEDDPRLQPAAQTQQKVPPIVSTIEQSLKSFLKVFLTVITLKNTKF